MVWAAAVAAFLAAISCVLTFGGPRPPQSSEQTEFRKHLPLDLYDVRLAAWRTTLEKNGKISMHFTQGSYVKGWGSWKLSEGKLVVSRNMQEQFDPETDKPVHTAPVKLESVYEVIFDARQQLLLDQQSKGSDGMWSVGNT